MTNLPSLLLRWSPLPLAALLLLMAILYFTVAPAVFYDPPWLIFIGNTLFIGAVGFAVAGIAWRNYVAAGQIQVLLLGCAMLLFGIGGVLAAVVRGLPGGANLNVTIYNAGALAGGVLHAVAALILLGGVVSEAGPARRKVWLALGYGGAVLFMAVLSAASLKGAIPPFFIQGTGPTLLRQQVLGGADLLFVFSFLIFMAAYVRNREPFLYWYAGGLALTAISLTGFFIQHSVGSPVGWVGRCAQYLGGIYFLMSLVATGRSAQRQGTQFDDVLTASLTAAEEKFRAAFANAPIGFAMMAPTGRYVDANPAYCALTGYSLAELRTLDFPQLVHPGDRTANLAQIQRMLAGQIPDFTVENRYVRKGGQPVWVRKSVSLVPGPKGKPRWIVALIEDITARKQAEQALRESETRLQAVLDGSPDPIFVKDLEGRQVLANPAMYAAIGKSAEACLGKTDEQFLDDPADGRAIMATDRRIMLSGQAETVEETISSPSGTRYYVSNKAPYRDAAGNITGLIGTARDITERKQAEAALRESEERLRKLYSAMNDGLALHEVVYDRAGRATDYRLLDVNPAFERITGISRERAAGALASALYGTGVPPYLDIYARVAETGEPETFEVDFEPMRKSFHISVFSPAKGQFATVFADISERKRTEARLAADLAALTRLHALSARTLQAEGLAPLLQEVMDAAVAIVDADHGTLQFLEGETLRIVAHHGHQPAFLEYFAEAENRASVCGAALARGERAVVPDVETSDLFVDTPSLPVLRAAGVRAVQSTPMFTREGKLIGILTTQWDKPYCPGDHELWRIDLLSRQASDLIENVRASEALRESEERERAKRRELETILAAIPAAVFIAEDPACTRMSLNPAGHRMLRLPEGANASKSAPEPEAPANFEIISADGKLLKPEELPVQMAAASGRAIEEAELEVRFADGDCKSMFGNALPLCSPSGEVIGAVGAFVDITSRKRAEEQVRLLLREVNHRSKNLLSVVQAIASQTAASGSADFIARFSARLQALAANQDLLVKSQWRGVELKELVHAQLAHFEDLVGGRIVIEGPPLQITAEAAQPIAMALHELGTNAGKYGALSNDEGKVSIAWGMGRDGTFHLSWTERGGPSVVSPTRRGFGTVVIAAVPEAQLDAQVSLDFPPSGVVWRLKCPAMNVIEPAGAAIDGQVPAERRAG
jgi:PAS domain S-box-containing protein